MVSSDHIMAYICSVQGELAVGTMVSFIGYTFTLTFAVSTLFGLYQSVLKKRKVLSFIRSNARV